MTSCKLYRTLILLTTLFYSVYGKGSLTFVVDNTLSMYEEISQLKNQTNSIFNLLETSEEKPYENVVLVTFNDPDVRLLAVTTYHMNFKRTLNSIRENGGGDCPEKALRGIKLAIENSQPFSTLFVFTDASAKDYRMYDEVAALVNNKNITINFILTGHCKHYNDLADGVYNRLADFSGGFVYRIGKTEVHHITQYVEDDIKRKRNAEIVANEI